MNPSISREELKKLIQNGESVLMIDVRSEEEYAAGHIPFASNIPLPLIESGDFVPDSGKILITACGRGGGRARKAAKFLSENYSNPIFTLDGGSLGWLDHEN